MQLGIHMMVANNPHGKEEALPMASGNVYSGAVFTDEVLEKAGVDSIEDINVADVNLVCPSLENTPLGHVLTQSFRLRRWEQTNQRHGAQDPSSCTPCARWCICAPR